MKSFWKVATIATVVMHVSLLLQAQDTAFIINRSGIMQDANFWIKGIGKTSNGVVLAKDGADGALTGIRLLNFAETRGANIQLTNGPAPGIATWVHDGTNWVERMRITATGYMGLGINTQAPGKRLDIVDTSSIAYTPTGTQAVPAGGIVQINNYSAVDGSSAHFLMTALNANGARNAAYIGITSNKGASVFAPDLVFGQRTTGNSWKEAMRIKGDGSVAIGTIDPGEYKLAVKGAIGATRVKVTQTGWADFVFEPEYKLPSLRTLETYIKENKHLPDVPSAKEVAVRGLDLGEMNKILLQKIEELTLHLIEQEKRNIDQDEKIKLMMKRLEKMEAN